MAVDHVGFDALQMREVVLHVLNHLGRETPRRVGAHAIEHQPIGTAAFGRVI